MYALPKCYLSDFLLPASTSPQLVQLSAPQVRNEGFFFCTGKRDVIFAVNSPILLNEYYRSVWLGYLSIKKSELLRVEGMSGFKGVRLGHTTRKGPA